MKRIMGFFFQGILYIVPVAVTAYILYELFIFFDDLIDVGIRGVGILILLVAVTLIGLLGKILITRPFTRSFNKLLGKAPLIQVIYSAVKDLVSAFVGKEKKFNQPVIVKISKVYELEKMGFITNEDLEFLGMEGKKVAVYFPHSYAFSGEMFFVSSDLVQKVNINSADAMKFIISAGITNIDENDIENKEPDNDK